MKRKHYKPSDKARRMGELISLKQSDAVAPSETNIAEMLKDMSFHISVAGRKEHKKNE